MTENDSEEGLVERIAGTVSGALGGEDSATGSEAVADVPTDVAEAARRQAEDEVSVQAERRFGVSDEGVADILPGGRGVATDGDDALTDRLNPGS
jgi:hypothetical protein